MDYITVSAAADKWNLTTEMVEDMCESGLIPNVEKLGDFWSIPSDARKPVEGISFVMDAERGDIEFSLAKLRKEEEELEIRLKKVKKGISRLETWLNDLD